MQEFYDLSTWPFNLMMDIANFNYIQTNERFSVIDEALSISLFTLRAAVTAALDERDGDIIVSIYKYGESHSSIASRHNITRERVRQIKLKSVRKLKDYIDGQRCVKAVNAYMISDAAGTIDRTVADKIPLAALRLSVRSYNGLSRVGCRTAGDVAAMTVDEVGRIRCLGKQSVAEIIAKLNTVGLSLNPDTLIIDLDLHIATVAKLNSVGIIRHSQLIHAVNSGYAMHLLTGRELTDVAQAIRRSQTDTLSSAT